MEKLQKIAFLSVVCFLGCNDSISTNYLESKSIQRTPVITGIYNTTVQYPSGTGLIYGSPSYNPSETHFNIVPNPYLGGPLFHPSISSREIVFIHLPWKAEIFIVEGTYRSNKNSKLQYLNGSVVDQDGFNVVRTMEKNSESGILFWDLKDNDGKIVPSGLYRIYLKSDYYPDIIWADLYLIKAEDRNKWIDPTGWLNMNVKINIIDGGS